ncbi:MAG: hypothetical protein AAF938_21660 [Myxococcota bacterium]
MGLASPTLGERALERLQARWVGRRSLLEEGAALLAGEASNRVLSLVGLPGVGKTALATMIQTKAAGPIRWVWCEHVVSLQELRDAAQPAGDPPALLVLDAFEHLGPLGSVFVREHLPAASSETAVLITSRERVAPLMPPALQAVHRERTLEPLAASEAVELLKRLQVDEARSSAIADAAGGLPLALVLAAEAGGLAPESEAEDVLDELVRELLLAVPSNHHRRALVASSIVAVDEARLQHVLGAEAAKVYPWLRARSYMRRAPRGVRPHQAVGEALYRRLSKMQPELLSELAQELSNDVVRESVEGDVDTMRRAYLEGLQMRRDVDALRMAFISEPVLRSSLHRIEASNVTAVAGAIEVHEGLESRAAFERQRARASGGFFAVHDAFGAPVGVHADVSAEAARNDDDPLLQAAVRIADADAEWREDGVGVVRWWMGLEHYHRPSAALSSVMASGPVISSLNVPIRRRALFVVEDPDLWEPLAAVMMLQRVPDSNLQAFGRTYGYYLLDLGSFTADWATPTVIRTASMALIVQHMTGVRAPTPRLDRTAFEDAVREALTDYLVPDRLAANALNGSPLAASFDEGGLASAIARAVAELVAQPGYEDRMLALEHTYLRPAVKQRAVAAELGVPFGTYRYRLRAGIEALIYRLWQLHEWGGP